MSPEVLGLVMVGVLIVAIFLGFPLAFTLIILGFVFGYLGFGPLVFDLMVLHGYGLMKEVSLAAVPLFIFMGYVLEQSGIMERLFRAFQTIMAPVRGSLYLAVLLTGTLFAAATGIIGASVTVLGMMAVPAMTRSRYDVRMAAGVITGAGCLGQLIPPSVMLIVMGPVLGVSIIHLFAAALVPGLALSAIYIVYAMVRSFVQPHVGPPLPLEERVGSIGMIVRESLLGMLPVIVLIFAALGSILAGLAAPTEAAGLAALGSVVLAIIYRQLTWGRLRAAVYRSLRTTSLILFLAFAALFYGAVFSHLGSATLITEWLVGLQLSPFAMLVMLMIVINLLGWPLEWPAIILIFLPLFLPTVLKLGIDMVWFGTLVAVNLQTAFLTPPVALAAYYLKAVAPEWELSDIYVGMLQFQVWQLLGLIVLLFFPELALWLPKVLYGYVPK
ncbi:MAG: TRAP transporter large permease subunit [Candidatus Rokubacteria bacterium]|nr:TRAP transporter large permease subunit [Candidatus Rokubacteria bacterium]MBI2554503.1 TRAP transporter large permease subunit [Candidatus Rokubacteria bacterium]